MRDLAERLVADFFERRLPALSPRHVELPRLKGKADVLVGMRRSGKTWFLYQLIQELEAAGVGRDRVLFCSFDDERLLPLSTRDLHHIPDAFFRANPQAHSKRCYFFFDEIQRVDGWEFFVRRLLDTVNAQIVVTGSSARLLGREIATQLRGRSLSTELFPFSFAEFAGYHGTALPDRLPGSARRSSIENTLDGYLARGGFPEIQPLDEHLRIRVLQEYVNVAVLRDVVERHGISNIAPLRYMIRHLLANPGGLFSINKFYHDLRSQGLAVGKNTLHEYFNHLSDAYLFFPVEIFSESQRARMVNPRKTYPVDPGLATAFSRTPLRGRGHLLETAVFLGLRRLTEDISYYRTASGREVDFAARDAAGRLALIQAALHLDDPQTRERELSALVEAMAEQNLRKASVVTLGDSETLKVNSGTINVIPAWQWLPHFAFNNG